MSVNTAVNKSEQGISHLLNDDQNAGLVEKICARVGDILTSEERIEYVAVQKWVAVNLLRHAVVLTNRRFIVYRPRLLGRVIFSDHTWRDLSDVDLHEGIIGATVTFRTVDDEDFSIGYLPKIQARRVYALAQEQQEKVRDERRRHELEEKRAAAGGIVMNSPRGERDVPADPEARLRRLKGMLDAGLISKAEFEAKKSEIVAKI